MNKSCNKHLKVFVIINTITIIIIFYYYSILFCPEAMNCLQTDKPRITDERDNLPSKAFRPPMLKNKCT